MLHEFLTANGNELVERCRAKAQKRLGPAALSAPAADAQNGVPLFIGQLGDALRAEQAHSTHPDTEPAPAPTEIGRAAALHGAELLRRGYTIDQVVHDYGDVCQAVTELAIERNQPIATNDFRVLNRCLDNAIADAVTAFGTARQAEMNSGAEALGQRLDNVWDEQQRLFDIAIQSFLALQTGKLGVTGPTAATHLRSLHALRALAQLSIADGRLGSAINTLPPSAIR